MEAGLGSERPAPPSAGTPPRSSTVASEPGGPGPAALPLKGCVTLEKLPKPRCVPQSPPLSHGDPESRPDWMAVKFKRGNKC